MQGRWEPSRAPAEEGSGLSNWLSGILRGEGLLD